MIEERTATASVSGRVRSVALWACLTLGGAACSTQASPAMELGPQESSEAAKPASTSTDKPAQTSAGRPAAAATTTGTQATAGQAATGGHATLGGGGASGHDAAGAGAAAVAGNTAGAAAGSAAGSGGAGPAASTAAGSGGASAAAGSAAGSGGGTSSAGSSGMAGVPAAGQAGSAGQGGAGSAGQTLGDYGKTGPLTVAIEKSVGANFRNTSVYDDTLQCEAFIASAAANDPNADPMVIEELTSYPADMDRGLYTLFRPETFQEGKKYPVITWGNGTCSHPFLFEELLKHLASHGFVIIATNWRWVSSGREMLNAIDFILSENENERSALFGKIDTKNLGATGHSQGSGATVVVGADARILATVPIQGASAADVARLKGPTFLIAGDKDMLVSASSVETAFEAATVPAVYGLALGQDHLMPGLNPAPILRAVTTWFKIHLTGDTQARDYFYGDACGLCTDSTWKVQRKNL